MKCSTIPLLLHGLLVPVALLAAVFYPRASHPAVLISVDGSPPAAAIDWGRRNHAPLVGLSGDGRSAILRLPDASAALAALGSGFVAVAADGALCADGTKDNGTGS